MFGRECTPNGLDCELKAHSHGDTDAHRMRIGCVHMNAHYFDSHRMRIEFALIEFTSGCGLDVHSKRIANIKRGRREEVM